MPDQQLENLSHTLHLLDGFSLGLVEVWSSPTDGHHVRDAFLDLLTDVLRFSEANLADLQELYLAAFDVDWGLAGPWLLEEAMDVVRGLISSKPGLALQA